MLRMHGATLMHEAVCLWCNELVAEDGDTCNLVCYGNLVSAINLATYIDGNDTPPKDLWQQPWYAALANTQEGTSEM